MQKILKAFQAITLNPSKYEEIRERIAINSGLMQVSLQVDDLRDSLAQVRNVLEGDLRAQLSELHDLIDSEPPSNDEESK